MRYYVITGERSGDLHAGNLMKELKLLDNDLHVRAVGGDNLKNAGAQIAWHYSEVAVMGFVEVLTQIRKIRGIFKVVKKDILEYNPDVLVLVDFGGFNLRMAKFAQKKKIRVYYYITPKVWAWNQKRALKIKSLVDRMFVILPFEKDFYQKYDWEVDYVGNPVMDAIKGFKPNPDFLITNKLDKEKPLIALLPGSRAQELQQVIPIYKELTNKFKDAQFVVAGVHSLPQELYKEISVSENLQVVYEQTYDLLNVAEAAIVTSGTATLETALFNVPQIVVYRTNPISYAIAKRVIRVEFISLVNLIAGRDIIPELIQKEMNIENITICLNKILKNEEYRKIVLQGYSEVRNILGEEAASKKGAELIFKYLKNDC